MLGRVFQKSVRKGKFIKNLNKLAAMNFRATPALGKKLNIGEAFDVLEHKISGISQVVSRYLRILAIFII